MWKDITNTPTTAVRFQSTRMFICQKIVLLCSHKERGYSRRKVIFEWQHSTDLFSISCFKNIVPCYVFVCFYSKFNYEFLVILLSEKSETWADTCWENLAIYDMWVSCIYELRVGNEKKCVNSWSVFISMCKYQVTQPRNCLWIIQLA